jgi:hypothetical protein
MKSILKLGILFITFNLSTVFCTGQSIINTEKLFISDTAKIGLIIEPSIDFQSGNTNVIELGNSINFFWIINNKNRIKIISGSDLLSEDSNLIINDHFGQLRYTSLLHKKMLLFAFGQIQSSNNLLIDKRIIGGGGLRFKALGSDSSRIKFDVAIGAMQEYEVLAKEQISDTHLYQNKIETNVTRLANFSILKIRLADDINLVNTIYYQPMVANFTDFRVLNDLDLIFSLRNWLAFTINFIYRYDSKSPDVLVSEDYFLNGGVIFSLNK